MESRAIIKTMHGTAVERSCIDGERAGRSCLERPDNERPDQGSLLPLAQRAARAQSGFTLVELLVVVAIVGILIAAMSFQFIGWRQKWTAEREIKQLYSDIVMARTKAIEEQRTYFLLFVYKTPYVKSYRFYADKTDATNPEGDEKLNTVTDQPAITNTGADKTPTTYETTITNKFNFPGNMDMGGLQFDRRGVFSTSNTYNPPRSIPYPIYITTATTPSKVIDADYTCIMLEYTRVWMGVWNATSNACEKR